MQYLLLFRCTKNKFFSITQNFLYLKGSEMDRVTKEASSESVQVNKLHEEILQLRKSNDQLLLKLKVKEKELEGIRENLDSVYKSRSFKIGNFLVKKINTLKVIWLAITKKNSKGILDIFNKKHGSLDDPADAFFDHTGRLEKIFANNQLVEIYEEEGVDAICDKIVEEGCGDNYKKSKYLISCAKRLEAAGYPEAEYPLIKMARNADKSEPTLRAFFWAAKKSLSLKEAYDCMEEIKELWGGVAKTEEQKYFFQEYEKTPVKSLDLLKEIGSKRKSEVASIKNRIYYVLHNSLPFTSGGYATRAHGLAQSLNNLGMEVCVVTRPGYPLDITGDINRDSVLRSEVIDRVNYSRILSPLRTDFNATEYVRNAAKALIQELVDLKPEYVVAASNHLTGLPALIAARELGIPFFYEVRGFWEITRVSRDPDFLKSATYKMHEIFEAEVAKEADHVFTLTGPMREELVRRGVDFEQITLLPNSCDPSLFRPQKRDETLCEELGIPLDVPVIGYVGTFVQYEGLEYIIEAAAELKASGFGFRVLLVGNENTSGNDKGQITQEIAQIAESNDLTDWVFLTGRVNPEEVSRYYSIIDICPFPRKPQPVTEMVSPMKPLEALSMCKAVVVSDVAALDEMIIEGETGLKFSKGSVQSLAHELKILLGDADLRTRLGNNGRDWVERSRKWEHVASTMMRKIESFSRVQE